MVSNCQRFYVCVQRQQFVTALVVFNWGLFGQGLHNLQI